MCNFSGLRRNRMPKIRRIAIFHCFKWVPNYIFVKNCERSGYFFVILKALIPARWIKKMMIQKPTLTNTQIREFERINRQEYSFSTNLFVNVKVVDETIIFQIKNHKGLLHLNFREKNICENCMHAFLMENFFNHLFIRNSEKFRIVATLLRKNANVLEPFL